MGGERGRERQRERGTERIHCTAPAAGFTGTKLGCRQAKERIQTAKHVAQNSWPRRLPADRTEYLLRGTPYNAVIAARGTPYNVVIAARGTPYNVVIAARGTPYNVIMAACTKRPQGPGRFLDRWTLLPRSLF